MKKLSIVFISLCIISCNSKKSAEQAKQVSQPVVEENGIKIIFPGDPEELKFFSTEKARMENIAAQYKAPASVAVSIIQSSERGGRNTVLFDDADLNAAYTQFLQHIININQYKVNLVRVKDLAQHGAAAGKEVLDAETQLANEEAAITEQDGRLKLAGLDPSKLRDPKDREAWLICEIPESQIAQVKKGMMCNVTFTAFGDEQFKGVVDGIGAGVDKITRMVKLRVILTNPSNKFKVGMFANVSFLLKEGNTISVPVSAIVNVQGKDYVFVKTSTTTFERREILAGQQLDNRALVLHGLIENEEVVTKGAMQMKGISFGY